MGGLQDYFLRAKWLAGIFDFRYLTIGQHTEGSQRLNGCGFSVKA